MSAAWASGLVKPKRIAPGDLLGVAALSGPCDQRALEVGCRKLEGWGYRIRLASNARSRGGNLGLSGSDDERLQGYLDLVTDPEVAAILFTRGGYGAARVLARLDPELVGLHPKIHCGFSDLTALSSYLLSRCGLPSFHGPMVAADLARDPEGEAGAFFPSMLEGRGPRELHVEEADILVAGTATGRLVGGCLSVLHAAVGTPMDVDLDGTLLLLEDVAEEAYRIDRMLGTLLEGGRFAKLSGILIGSFARITFGGTEDAGRLRDLFVERLAPLGVPVAMGLPFGHRGPNVTLPIGGLATWDAGSRILRFEEEIVS